MQDLIWTLVGFFLTLLVFTYLFGDNFFFRLASYLFVGVSAGYVGVTVIYQVILPRLILPLLQGSLMERLFVLVPLVMAALLLTKLSNQLAPLGKLPMAYLVGVGAAVAIGGAVFGTLIGQVSGAARPFDVYTYGAGGLLEGLLLLVGRTGRAAVVETLALIGQVFIGIALGAVFAGVFTASLTALMDRIQFLLTVIAQFTSG
jgi:hypothetical protein